jgi:phage replication-related protein YjqB (UPF0714/DUF867 family)
MDAYASFQELRRYETEGVDFIIRRRLAGTPIAIMAPHGGGIEPGTAAIADAVAADVFSFYAFIGRKPSGNRHLHLTSSRFDEPRGLALARRAHTVITIHGSRHREAIVSIGGRNQPLQSEIRRRLQAYGIRAALSQENGLRGIDMCNLCNRCRSRQGVQLEISKGLRQSMFKPLTLRSTRRTTVLFTAFVDALKDALASYVRLLPSADV